VGRIPGALSWLFGVLMEIFLQSGKWLMIWRVLVPAATIFPIYYNENMGLGINAAKYFKNLYLTSQNVSMYVFIE